MKNKNTRPKLAQKILLRFIRDDIAEEVLGDLDEKFYVTLKTKSYRKAKIITGIRSFITSVPLPYEK